MSKIRTDRIQYLMCPSIYHQFIHGLGKPHHLAPLHFRRHGQSVRVCHHVYKYRPVNIHRLFQHGLHVIRVVHREAFHSHRFCHKRKVWIVHIRLPIR